MLMIMLLQAMYGVALGTDMPALVLADVAATYFRRGGQLVKKKNPIAALTRYNQCLAIEEKLRAFEFVDLDGNGEMDLDEAMSQGMTPAMFRMIDADGTGTVTLEEYQAFEESQLSEGADAVTLRMRHCIEQHERSESRRVLEKREDAGGLRERATENFVRESFIMSRAADQN